MDKPKKHDPFHGHRGMAQHAAMRHAVANKAHRHRPNIAEEPSDVETEKWQEYSDKAKTIFGAVENMKLKLP